MTKISKISNFIDFTHFFKIFAGLWIETLKRISQGFSGEFNAVFQVKLARSDTENDKNLEIIQYSNILCIFSPNF